MKVIIAAGGTGGHLFPGLAVARKLKEKETGSEVIFIGRKKGWEMEIVMREGFGFMPIFAGGWLGKSMKMKFCSAVKALAGFFQSLFMLIRLRPQVVVGMGSYVSGPFVMAALLLRIPTIIHEQNLVPGFTNKVLGRFVDEVEVSFPESSRFFPGGRVKVTGNPVREEIWRKPVSERKSRSKRTLLVMGGSQGAHRINQAVAGAVGSLKEKMRSWNIIHIAGREDCRLMERTYKETGMDALVYPFLRRMEEAYRVADLVVARAGATTLAEITACGLPAVLIPYPSAAGNHQEENARWLEKRGAVVTIRDGNLTGERLAETILNLIADEKKLFLMAENSRKLGKPGATEAVAARVMALASK